ncbi:phosphatidylethanolamine-binding protein 4 [Arapaima gigas]
MNHFLRATPSAVSVTCLQQSSAHRDHEKVSQTLPNTAVGSQSQKDSSFASVHCEKDQVCNAPALLHKQIAMLLSAGLVLLACAGVLNLQPVWGKKPQQETETLSDSDSQFCHGGLRLIYPELEMSSCTIVPQTDGLRRKLSSEWGVPRVQLEHADQEKKYTLMMVDPDAPSRRSPTRSHWRHWLVVDILGSDLQKGDIKGSVLTEYRPPSPPANTGLHRYQFLLFEQPSDGPITLSEKEKSSLAAVDMRCRCFLSSATKGLLMEGV